MLKRFNRLTNEFAMSKVMEMCNKKDYTFISFCDNFGNECEYMSQLTHIKIYCNKCKKIWYSATYNRFIHGGTNCPNCNKLSENEALSNIEKICKNLNYTFLFFCDKNGKKTNWTTSRNTYLFLRCNNCGNEWHTCSYANFIRGRKCPSCKSYFKNSKLDNFLIKCKKNNWKILGFYDDNNKEVKWPKCVKIKLKCQVCGYVWYKTLSSLNNKSGCPHCAIEMSRKKHLKKESDCLPNILDLCLKRNYEFLGYCDKSGNDCEWFGHSTYLKLKCLICGNMWNTCSYYNFIHHLRGCPMCKQSHLENEVRTLLLDNEIQFEPQKRFDWLGGKSLDFYIPSKNIAIECQGRQHFEIVEIFGGENEFVNIKNRDTAKRKLCNEHGINVLYYSNLNKKYPYEVIEDKSILLKKITE